jgi:hypothetical protein
MTPQAGVVFSFGCNLLVMVHAGWMNWNQIKSELIDMWQVTSEVEISPLVVSTNL